MSRSAARAIVSHITSSLFSDRFVTLVIGARDLPKKPTDFHVLLVSSILGLEPGREYREDEVNDELQRWVLLFGSNFGVDHVTLRRHLVDAKHLSRDPAGEAYRLRSPDHPYSYDPGIRSIDLQALISKARKEREMRKQQYSRTSQ